MNDTLGHDAGNEVLKLVVERIEAALARPRRVRR
ncbi:diguanylate cyclase [Solirubrobacter sp. CPCC 204708]|nr:diguanylate cyclase [Solirubrobacter deserti]